MRLVERIDTLMTRDRLIVYPVAVLVAFSFATVARWVSGSTPLPDFVARWTAGRLVAQGNAHDLYDIAAQAAVQSAELGSGESLSLFVSPPFVAAVCAPLGMLPYGPAALLWTGFSVAGLALASRLLAAEFAPRTPSLRRGTFLVVLASYPVVELVGGGQDSAFVLLGAVGCLRFVSEGRPALAGAVLAATLIKPHLVFVLPVVLLAKRRWRALLSLTLTSVAVVGATTILFGFSSWSQWLGLVLNERYGGAVHEGQAWKSASLTGLVATVSGFGEFWIAGVALLATVAAMATWVLVRRPGAPLNLAWAWALFAGVVTSPHAMIYDVVLLLPLVFALMSVAWTAKTRVLLLAWTMAMSLVAPIFVMSSALDSPPVVTAPWHVLITCMLGFGLAQIIRGQSRAQAQQGSRSQT